MKRIDFKSIASIPNALVRHEKLDEEIRRVGDDITLTDCLVWREKGGAYVLRHLDEESKDGTVRMFRLRVRHDMWGNPVHAGDTVEWLFKLRTRDSHGRKVLRRDVNAARIRGEGRLYEVWHSATVDDDGCITVPYRDAALLLDKHGVHYESGEPITGQKEFATEAQYYTISAGRERAIKTDAERRRVVEHGGQVIEKLRHNWLYEEVPPAADPPVQKRRKGKANADPAGGEE